MVAPKKNILVFSAFAILTLVVILHSSNFPLVPDPTNGKAAVPQTGNVATISVPAVDLEGRGTIGKFEVQVLPGNGKILTNIEHLLFFVDTQFSMQTAKSVAVNITGADLSRYNLVYDIDPSGELSSTRVVEGPSAGAALTIATVAAIENKVLDPEVMITGTIRPDGTVGRIGGVSEKARAAREAGAKILLVPAGQGLIQSFRPETTCEFVGRIKVCRTSYEQEETAATNEDGLVVKEVSNIREALKYFIQ